MTRSLRSEAIRGLYGQTRNATASALFLMLYMVGTAWPFTAWPAIAGWAGIVLIMQFSRGLLMRAWNRREVRDEELEAWVRRYTLYQACAGLVWGSSMFLFAHPDQPITVALTLCCLFATASGSMPAQAYNPPTLIALVAVMFAQVVVRLVATGEWGYIILAAASVLYALMMVAFCRVQARSLEDGFRIRHENRELVQALTVEKAAAIDARRRAETANLAKSQFLAAASHDLRQPLYALSLFSASLNELRLEAVAREVVGEIQNSVGVLEALFEGLLDLSKLEAGVIRPELTPVSVDRLFDRLSQVFRPIALEQGLDLRLRSDGEWALSDAVVLEQVLSNLLSNALRATEAGGVLVAVKSRQGRLRFEVWDTGRGIGEADRQRIFEEFVQLGNPERDRRKGLGLGLSIAQRGAALIGAEIDLASKLGVGSRFAFWQPGATNTLGIRPTPEAEACPVERHQDTPVLVVEDDADVRRALGELLSRWRAPHDLVATAAEALAKAEAGATYRLILADYRLAGGLNGLDLIGRLRELYRWPVPAALITADFDPMLLERAEEMGVALLNKPLRAATLRSLVASSEAHPASPCPAE